VAGVSSADGIVSSSFISDSSSLVSDEALGTRASTAGVVVEESGRATSCVIGSFVDSEVLFVGSSSYGD